jgi:hypothetical protein
MTAAQFDEGGTPSLDAVRQPTDHPPSQRCECMGSVCFSPRPLGGEGPGMRGFCHSILQRSTEATRVVGILRSG